MASFRRWLPSWGSSIRYIIGSLSDRFARMAKGTKWPSDITTSQLQIQYNLCVMIWNGLLFFFVIAYDFSLAITHHHLSFNQKAWSCNLQTFKRWQMDSERPRTQPPLLTMFLIRDSVQHNLPGLSSIGNDGFFPSTPARCMHPTPKIFGPQSTFDKAQERGTIIVPGNCDGDASKADTDCTAINRVRSRETVIEWSRTA